MDLISAQNLLRSIVQHQYERRHKPIPGAALKAELLQSAEQKTDTFSEKSLGFGSFLEFVSKCPGISHQLRQGSDFLVVPGDIFPTLPSAESVEPHKRRIRRDFWFAFVSFDESGTRRVYDREGDRVLYEPVSSPLSPSRVEITPITSEQQLSWRRDYAAQLPPERQNEFAQALNSDSPFRDFSVVIRRQPDLDSNWKRFWVDKIAPIVEGWATGNNVPLSKVFMDMYDASEQISSSRAELYKLFDTLPLDALLDFKVSLRHLLRKN
jgi:hypothetical protein